MLGVFAVQRDDAASTVEPHRDGRRHPQGGDASTFDGAAGLAARRRATRPARSPRTLDRLAVAYVVDGVGAAQRALELAVEYAKERVQFDKPIGSFQAVQHLCADMLRAVELGRAAGVLRVLGGRRRRPDGGAPRRDAWPRRSRPTRSPQLGGTAIQVFGGIGFTWEHDIHLFYKRLLTLSVALGTSDDHLAELATLAID